MKHLILATTVSLTAAAYWLLLGAQTSILADTPTPEAPLSGGEDPAPARLGPEPRQAQRRPARHPHDMTIVVKRESEPSQAAKLLVALSGIRPRRGPIQLALFNASEGFPRRQRAVRVVSVTPETTEETVTFGDLASGSYAVAAFQDLNEDGMLNKGAFGVPREPYGFSRNARGSFGPPAFEAAAVDVGHVPVTVEVLLR